MAFRPIAITVFITLGALVGCGGDTGSGSATGGGGTGNSSSGGTGNSSSGGAAGSSIGGAAGSSGGAAGSGGSVSLDQLASELAKTECGLYEKCVGQAISVFFGDEDCVTVTTSRVENGGLSQLETAVDSGKVSYDPALAAQCLADIAARTCDELDNRSSDICEQAVAGTVPLDGDCQFDFDCQGKNYCKFSGSCPGKCAPREAAGGSCNQNDDCQDGLVCSKQTNACVKPAAANESCGGGVAPDCASALFCVGADAQSGQAGTCQATADVFSATSGQTCSWAAGPLCAGDLACVYSSVTGPNPTGTCQAKVASGAACKTVSIPNQCPSGEYCAGPTTSLDGTCTAKPAAGEPCATTPIGTVCAAYTRCESGNCVALQANGGPCSQDAVCYSEHCVQGGCKINACN
jgi:hypothetical protein